MEAIDILTGQHVTIKYEPAGILRRGCALIIDFIILFIYIYIFFFSFSKINENISLPIKNVTNFVILFPAICYLFFFETLMGGKTPGKLIAGTRVTNLDGSTPGLSSYQSLSQKVKNTLKVESQLDDRSFLETIVRDYNYYAWHSMH
jgi:uncharacterized RDD family membrane protein YckC